MHSAHRPTICRKQLREKIGVNVRFFISVLSDWVSAHDPIFYRRQQIGPTLRFLWECYLAHTARFLSEYYVAVRMNGDVSLFHNVTPIFIELKSAHMGRFFYRRQNCGKKSFDFHQTKNQRTRADFNTDFLSTIKNIGPCAQDINYKPIKNI